MKKAVIALLLFATIGVLVLTNRSTENATVPVPDPVTALDIAQGQLVGFSTETGAHAWLGIPFAAPPVGDLRWRAPRPAMPWTGVLDAVESGSPCVQIGGPLGGVPEEAYGEVVGSEDCLFLNVWAPPSVPAGGLPVMVWIHGGGNTIGQAADYDGQYLATEQQVVVVAVNYRLGVFGWLTHPLVHAGGTNPLDASGNFGTLDNIASLAWVRDNISAFGGDPDNVTVFGESAGGRNVLALLTAPGAEGLFHRAIVQSGVAQGESLRRATALPADGGHSRSSTALMARWLVDTGRSADEQAALSDIESGDVSLATALRQLDSRRIMAGFPGDLGGMFDAPQLFEDGIVLPEIPQFQVFTQPGAIHDVPVMLGTNRDEMKLFMAQTPRYTERTLGLFVKQLNVGDYELEAAYRSRYWKALGVDELARAMVAAGKSDVYAYRFDWDEGADTIFADLGALLGAAHGLEIPFVFGDFSDFFGNTLIFDDSNAASRASLSGAMMQYWGNFARRGSPGGDNSALPVWMSWGAGQYMVLDSPADGGPRMSDDTESILGLVAELTDEPGFSEVATLCRVYAVSNFGTPWWSDTAYQALGDGACSAYPASEQPRF